MISVIVSSGVFFANNVATDLENCLYAVFQIAGYVGLSYMFISAFILRKRIDLFFATLDTICQESKH